jgi:F-type H+-transporting ATPase subunit gamma
MATLKAIRKRIGSIRNTQQITKAMKMVAAAKLRRAQEAAVTARPYAERMERMLTALAASVAGQGGAPRLLAGTGREATYLLVVATADRGLCGGFNSTIIRAARRRARALLAEGKTVKLFCVGRKAADVLKREFGHLIVERVTGIDRPKLDFARARGVAEKITQLFDGGGFDVCLIFFNRFKSALTQIVTEQQLIPFRLPAEAATARKTSYEYEPGEDQVLAALLPRNLAVQMFSVFLENKASEHGARMTAMDNATRNAGEMIEKLTLRYNRARQANITKELIEIISGAEAV